MSWKHIQGHDALVKGFAHVALRHRLAHAYLFVGPQGVGKRLFAKELAKTLLCERRGEVFEACDHCESCILVEANTHPDYFAVGKPEEKNEVPIEVMKELCRSYGLKSARGVGKIGVLDDADHLNDESANCFLKTLEEPPPKSTFILVGTSLDQQMATILSRCQVVRFSPLPTPVMKDLLTRNQIAMDLHARLINLAGGSPGQALELADPELWDFRKKLLEGLVHHPADTPALGKMWIEFAEDAGKETALHRQRAALVLRLLLDFFAEALTLSTEGNPKTTDPGDLSLLNGLISRGSTERILGFLDRLLEAEVQLNRYIQIALVLEGLLDQWGQRWDDRALVRV